MGPVRGLLYSRWFMQTLNRLLLIVELSLSLSGTSLAVCSVDCSVVLLGVELDHLLPDSSWSTSWGLLFWRDSWWLLSRSASPVLSTWLICLRAEVREQISCSTILVIGNTNSACQVEFTEHKSSHIGIELEQRPSKVLRRCPADYKVSLSGSEAITVTCLTWWVDYF